VIAEHRAANAEWDRRLLAHESWYDANKGPDSLVENDHDGPEYAACEAAGNAEAAAHWRLWRTMPTSAAGFAAWLSYLQTPRWPIRDGDPNIVELAKRSIFWDAVHEVWSHELGRDEGDAGVPALAEWLTSMEIAFRRMTLTT
jgi:hypothetical protein